MKKIIILISILFLAGGCDEAKFITNYNKMKTSKDGINGYKLDLRIYGKIKDTDIIEVWRIENYNDTDFKITKIGVKKDYNNENTIYVIDGKKYVFIDSNEYNLISSNIKYDNPTVYLEGLKNVTKILKSTKEKDGEIIYRVYEVSFTKEIIQKIIDDIAVSDVKISEDNKGKIYITEKGYIYRIIYNIDNITINANYFGIDETRSISLPALNRSEGDDL